MKEWKNIHHFETSTEIMSISNDHKNVQKPLYEENIMGKCTMDNHAEPTKKLRQPDRYLDGSTHHQWIFLPRKIKSQCDQASRYNSQFPGNKLQKNILNETRRVQSTRSRIWETLQAK